MNIRNKDTTSTTSQRGNMIVFSDVNSIQAGLGAYRENFNSNRRSGLAFLVGDEPAGYVDYHTASTALINQSISEKMRLTPDGRLGIGTKTPETTLHVQGDSTFYGHLLPGTNNIYDLGSSTKQFRHFYLSANSTFLDGTKVGYWMNLTGNEFTHQTGNVGIGTNSPKTQLHISHDFHIAANDGGWNTTSGKGLYMRYSTHSSQDRAYIQSIDRSNSSTFYPLNLEGSKFNFNGGNVGIGTDEPSATLHLGSQNEEIRFGDGTTNRSSLVFKGHNTGTTFVNRYAIKNVGGSSGEAHVWYDDTGTAEMTLLNNGYLGIGETAPTYKLDVNGIIRTTDNARINEAWIGNWNSDDNYAQFTHHAI